MTETKTFQALNINPLVYFTGTDAEIEQAEQAETAAIRAINEIVSNPLFIALEWQEKAKNGFKKRILHHSTRPGILFQLSYIDADGVPAMHENYISTNEQPLDNSAIHDKQKLLETIVNRFTGNDDLTIKVVTA